ncbi:MAG TPA: hypothetical protein VFU15_11420 [Bacteroidia bacterium]|nr:hypothetical protein [Bacteroidia bacterium]
MLLLSMTMVLVFLGLGFLFLFTRVADDRFPAPQRYGIGGVLVAWAAFRTFTVWRKFKDSQKEEENE